MSGQRVAIARGRQACRADGHIWSESENVRSRALRPFNVKDTPVVVNRRRPTEPFKPLSEYSGAIDSHCVAGSLRPRYH
jgi:hypothetical protein